MAAELVAGAEIDNAVLEGISGVTRAIHICRGNPPVAAGWPTVDMSASLARSFSGPGAAYSIVMRLSGLVSNHLSGFAASQPWKRYSLATGEPTG
jgi:hypothetical protein